MRTAPAACEVAFQILTWLDPPDPPAFPSLEAQALMALSRASNRFCDSDVSLLDSTAVSELAGCPLTNTCTSVDGVGDVGGGVTGT